MRVKINDKTNLIKTITSLYYISVVRYHNHIWFHASISYLEYKNEEVERAEKERFLAMRKDLNMNPSSSHSHSFRLGLLKIENLKHEASYIWLPVYCVCETMNGLLNSGCGWIS